MKTINELLEEIAERADKAPSGPWFKGSWSGKCHLNHHHGKGDCVYDYTRYESDCVSSAVVENMELIGYGDSREVLSPATADFIAHARTDVPSLVAEVQRLRTLCQLVHDRLLRGDSDMELMAMLDDANNPILSELSKP